MATSVVQRLVLVALTAVFGGLSAIPRGGMTTVCLATGDHLHVLFGSGNKHTHDHGHEGLAHGHDFDHAAAAAEGEALVCDVHCHACVDIELPSGDCKLDRSAAAGYGVDQGWAALPPLPPGVADAVPTLRPHPDQSGPSTLLGLTPPDLARSTVLLI